MYNLRTELIKSILSSLKIDDNPFNQQIIKDKIAHIADMQLQEFYGKLFNASHQYLNGIDRVSKVADNFKPNVVEIDKDEEKAKELIELAHSMNNTIYQEHIRTGIQFDVLLNDVKFPTVDKSIIAILDNVKPYYNHKQLISSINLYGTAKEQLQAFKQAVKQGEVTQIALSVKKLLN